MEDPKGTMGDFENQSWETTKSLEPVITVSVTQTPDF